MSLKLTPISRLQLDEPEATLAEKDLGAARHPPRGDRPLADLSARASTLAPGMMTSTSFTPPKVELPENGASALAAPGEQPGLSVRRRAVRGRAAAWPTQGTTSPRAPSRYDRRRRPRRALRRISPCCQSGCTPRSSRTWPRGQGPPRRRRPPVRRRGDALDPESNYLFGEGAGTFSDGKLTSRGTGGRRPPCPRRNLADCHAKPSIVYEQRPHLGSNRLPLIVRTLRRISSEELGGEIRFSCRVEDLDIATEGTETRLRGLPDQLERHRGRGCRALAIGHSARHLYHAAAAGVFPSEAKPFQIGVRIEQPQEQVNHACQGGSPTTLRSVRPTTSSLPTPAAATCSPSACADSVHARR